MNNLLTIQVAHFLIQQLSVAHLVPKILAEDRASRQSIGDTGYVPVRGEGISPLQYLGNRKGKLCNGEHAVCGVEKK